MKWSLFLCVLLFVNLIALNSCENANTEINADDWDDIEDKIAGHFIEKRAARSGRHREVKRPRMKWSLFLCVLLFFSKLNEEEFEVKQIAIFLRYFQLLVLSSSLNITKHHLSDHIAVT
ncbi:hypothetical protein Bhyg_06584, partial [Pseudolycoriella hygida]